MTVHGSAPAGAVEVNRAMLYQRMKRAKRFLNVRYKHHSNLVKYHGNLVQQRLRGARSVRVLLVSSGDFTTNDAQFDPIWRYSSHLSKRFGVVVCPVRIDEALRLTPAALDSFDAVGFQFFFRTPTKQVLETIDTLRSRSSPRIKFLYFDGDDDLGILWPQILGKVDLYVKNHVMVDRTFYLRSTIGKSNLTDYVATHYGTSFDSNEVPRSTPVTDKADLEKIFLGWNLGSSNRVYKPFKQYGAKPVSRKDIDISCRVLMPPGSWLTPLRLAPIRELQRLAGEYQVVASMDRVPAAQFQDELARSRICVSPFGHGEICFRDFEAVLHGCLLIKPDMGHLESRPDIYVPGETYVPVRWDFADLGEKCRYYLENDEERARIANHATEVLRNFYDNREFIDIFAQLLERLGPPIHVDGARQPAITEH